MAHSFMHMIRGLGLIVAIAAGSGCVANSRIGIQPTGDGGSGAGGVGAGGIGAGGVGTGGVGTGGVGTGGAQPDGSAVEAGACTCSSQPLFSPLSTSVECLCGSGGCIGLDEALGPFPPPDFTCSSVFYYAGCSLTAIATQRGADPVNLHVY